TLPAGPRRYHGAEEDTDMKAEAFTANGVSTQLVLVRPEPPGQFTAEVVGLPELRATAPSREEAIQQVRTRLGEWLASGQLVAVTVPVANPSPRLPRIDPNDPGEQIFLEELARLRKEDLENTLREYEREDQQCSSSSSTPTT